jgi:ABC-type multidrug transport system fused ATPase/permease subunit
VLLGLLVTGSALLSLVLVGHAIGRVFTGGSLQDALPLLGGAAGAAGARFVFLYTQDTVGMGTASRVKAALRTRIYRHLLLLGPGYLERRRTGELVAHAVDGVEALEVYFGKYLPQLFVATLAPIGILIFLWTLHPAIALVLAVAFPLAFLAPAIFQRVTRRVGRGHWHAWSDLSSLVIDSLQGLTTLKAFARSRERGREIEAEATSLYRATMKALLVNLWGSGVREFVVAGAIAAALAVGAQQAAGGQIEIRSLIVVLLLGREIFRPLNELSMLYHEGLNGVSASVGIFDLLGESPEVAEPRHPSAAGPRDYSIDLEQVTFGYDGGQRPALDGFDLTIEAGKTVALVGPSGVGKTTILNLLMRYFDPQRGRILVGGVDLRDMPLEGLRALFASVSQETYLFSGTIADNIRLARADADNAAVEAAARAANAHDFITRMPKGYDTEVGERGLLVSGGERQRIAIARALLKDAPILLLDEPTSSVDAANEEVIQKAIHRLAEGRTTLLVAHRLSTVMDADAIVVMEEGRVAEIGRHAELLAKGGAYARLIAAQQVGDPSVRATIAGGSA